MSPRFVFNAPLFFLKLTNVEPCLEQWSLAWHPSHLHPPTFHSGDWAVRILTDDAVLLVQQRGAMCDAGLLSSCSGRAGPAGLSGWRHEGGRGGGVVWRGH